MAEEGIVIGPVQPLKHGGEYVSSHVGRRGRPKGLKNSQTTMDHEAEAALGIPIKNITEQELEYLVGRKKSLEAIECAEPLLIQEVLISEHNIKRIRAQLQTIANPPPAAEGTVKSEEQAKLEGREQRKNLASLNESMDTYMSRYHKAMDGLGARNRKKSSQEQQANPLSEIWLRYVGEIKKRKKTGEGIGCPSKEAMALAKAKSLPPEGYIVNGVLIPEEREDLIDSVEYPTNIDEKKKRGSNSGDGG